MKLLVTNADDFGLDPAINAAVIQGHTRGALTSTSLLITAPYARQAIELARANPSLDLGLHLCLVDGVAASAHNHIAPLVNSRGELPANPAALCRVISFRPTAARAIEVEARTQIEAFLQTGLRPTHLDTHMHTHLHPVVLRIVARLAVEYQIRFVRAPWEPLAPSLASQRESRMRTLARGVVFSTLGCRCRRHLQRFGLRTADRTVGVLNPGQLTEKFLTSYLPLVPEGLTEMAFHPALQTTPNLAQRQPGYRHIQEYEAICSPSLRTALDTFGIRLTNFRDLGR
jgi:hopanoid biosynthesis associated protein HpnK